MIDGITKKNHCRWYFPTLFLKHVVCFYSDFQSLRSNLIQALQLEKFFVHLFFCWTFLHKLMPKNLPTIFFRSSTLVLGVFVDSYFFDASQWGLGGSPYASKSSWYPSFWFGSFGKSGHGRRQLRGSLAATAPTCLSGNKVPFFCKAKLVPFFWWFLEVSEVKWL